MTVLKQERSLRSAEEFVGVAILLAAGVGRRLSSSHQGPKVLLSFAGRSLLQRSIGALYSHGVRQLTITVGFEASAVRDEVKSLLDSGKFERLDVNFVVNSDYEQGSMISLHCQSQTLRTGGTVLLLDGDVLYDAAMITRLIDSESEGVLLVDRHIEPGDEPVKICFDAGGKIVDFRKIPEKNHSWFGESVGFFRFSGSLASELAERCDWYSRQGLVSTEYEEAIRDLILMHPERFRAVDVSDLAWTEIDFPEDVIKARETVLPQIKD